ncbi:MAG: hypothetical protein Kow0069_30310 [Promethearchaeota archaeon]
MRLLNGPVNEISLKLAGRTACVMLACVDAVLGPLATFLPGQYAAVVHPLLVGPQTDLVTRTGVLWLAFFVLQVRAATSKGPARWFFVVGVVRLVEVPADLVYAAVGLGMTHTSRSLVLAAPPVNAALGSLLVACAKKLGPGSEHF